MPDVNEGELLKVMSNQAWDGFLESISGLTEPLAWASVSLQPDEYLHTEGSILSQIAHVANGKFIYGSVGFRNTELRWRELSPQIDARWPRLDAVIEWAKEAHAYWMASWAEVTDFQEMRPRFDGSLHEGWKLISIQIQHDQHHAGQIHLQRVLLSPTTTPPPPEGALWESYCRDFPCW